MICVSCAYVSFGPICLRCKWEWSKLKSKPHHPDGTFWLGADVESVRTEINKDLYQPSRDLRDMTISESAIYRQAYAEGYDAARKQAEQNHARDWGVQGSADIIEAAGIRE